MKWIRYQLIGIFEWLWPHTCWEAWLGWAEGDYSFTTPFDWGIKCKRQAESEGSCYCGKFHREGGQNEN